MKRDQQPDDLSRRERQIMDIIYRDGEATAAQVRADLDDPPSYSAVRALLRILEGKGHLRHREDGVRYVYVPTQSTQSAARNNLHRVVQTFFGGSIEKVVATLLSEKETQLTEEEVARLNALIESARAKNEKKENEK
jgi:predicted transcriptional regulator